MIKLKSAKDLERMRVSCGIAAKVLDEVKQKCVPGVTTGELDEFAAETIKKLGAKSAFYGYRRFPRHICTSVNEEVVHGIPGDRKIGFGDIVSIDIGVVYDGWVGDNATTVMVGVTDPETIRLVQVTERALENAVSKALAGGWLGDISHAVEQTAIEAGFAIVREFVGHGIGRDMHEDPQIPNFGPPGKKPRLKPGMTLAIEPMINMGTPEVKTLEDNWTVITRDGKPSAHFEYTVAVLEDGPEILTRKENA